MKKSSFIGDLIAVTILGLLVGSFLYLGATLTEDSKTSGCRSGLETLIYGECK